MPSQSPTDYVVQVGGIGTFTFARRTVRLQVALDVEVQRLSEGVEVQGALATFIRGLATVKTLAVSAPDGWKPEDADPFDQDSFDRVIAVWEALREQEQTFRKKPEVAG